MEIQPLFLVEISRILNKVKKARMEFSWEGLTSKSYGQSKGKWPTEVRNEYVQRFGDSLRRMVDHPTLLVKKENGLPKVGEKHL
ncbi:hypothetical protein H5410_036157 [Solanum commersonii]|uniref:Uncharacterized protein n=1 Tax=Solanum commersonii TaxID=4109 RepID=A0A9J5Y3Z1_SOLCO|nr:hypothetical protein H5410_036157 [Solanum commersonii]